MKIFLTGSSGFLGSNFINHFKHKNEIIACYQNNIPLHNGTTLKIDFTQKKELAESIEKHKPDAIFHFAAASQPNWCEQNKDESYAINVLSVEHLIEVCSPKSIPIVFTSTDLVFDGSNAPYSECDERQPLMEYGKQKVLAEDLLIKYYNSNSVVCRMPLMYGNPLIHKGSFLSGIINNLKENKEVSLFIDEIRTIVSAKDACEGLMISLNNALGKIVHLGGTERLSRLEIGNQICDAFKLEKKLLKSTKQADVVMPAKRPKDVSLDSSFAFSLGYQPKTHREELKTWLA